MIYYALWGGTTGNPGAGILAEQELLVATGETIRGLPGVPSGVMLSGIGLSNGEGGFAMSPNGRYVLFDARFDVPPYQAVCLLDRQGSTDSLRRRSRR